MNSRRRALCLGSAAVALMGPCVPWAATSPTRIAVFGLGGAGCNILEAARAQRSFPAQVLTATVNASDTGRCVEVQVRRRQDGSLEPREVASLAASVRTWRHVLFVAGLRGRTGVSLLLHLADAARSSGATSAAVVIAPFSFEVGVARENLTSVVAVVDHVAVLDNARLLKGLPCDTTWDVCLRHANDSAAALVRRHVLRTVRELRTSDHAVAAPVGTSQKSGFLPPARSS